MPKVARSNSIRIITATALLAVGGCAQQAAQLPSSVNAMPPPTVTPEERIQRCTALAQDIATLRSEQKTIEQVIGGSRRSDQVNGYLAAVLFPPLALAIDQQTAQKKALTERQAKIDAALAQQHALACPST